MAHTAPTLTDRLGAAAQDAAPRPPIAQDALDEIEATLGLTFPAILRSVWTELANGGFGPGYGLLGIGPDGYPDDLGQTADTRYRTDRADPGFDWPEGLLPICHFGCAVYHCVDCRTGEMLIWEPNAWDDATPPATALYVSGIQLEDWFAAWARNGALDMYLRPDSTGPDGFPRSLADLRARSDP
ncbi:SMI1/KNR4 family protein [Litorisediminicola beolgyonensis]|uniref:SMI1/KNR4 family protein n=1 Tax=Litorisediminicola beolgyonensis TaxID=1173614 RepID=A0ABW3ZDX9_9RHOB